MRLVKAVSIGGLLALTATRAVAQLADLIPGARIRMQAAPDSARVDGTIISRDGDSIVLATLRGSQRRARLPALQSVHLYRGRSRLAGAKRGLIWGAVVAAVPLAIAFAAANPERDRWSRSDQLQYSLFVIGVDGITGGVIGAFVRADRWQQCTSVTAPTCDSRP